MATKEELIQKIKEVLDADPSQAIVNPKRLNETQVVYESDNGYKAILFSSEDGDSPHILKWSHEDHLKYDLTNEEFADLINYRNAKWEQYKRNPKYL